MAAITVAASSRMKVPNTMAPACNSGWRPAINRREAIELVSIVRRLQTSDKRRLKWT